MKTTALLVFLLLTGCAVRENLSKEPWEFPEAPYRVVTFHREERVWKVWQYQPNYWEARYFKSWVHDLFTKVDYPDKPQPVEIEKR